MSAFSAGRRWFAVIVASLLAIGTLTTATLAGPARAGTTAVPAPATVLPAEVDWRPEYQGQVLCDPDAKPGAKKLAALLDATYGSYTSYIARACGADGLSEHKEGRAIDWMVNSTSATARAKAWAFLDWLTADGPDGEPGANARRLGIMYLIYEDRMWRTYDPGRGWAEYSSCSAKQADQYDTSCHRDHIHISLSWDGAYARTSFWTGTAQLLPPCASTSATRPAGTATQPSTLINSFTGAGLGGTPCRIAADTWLSRSYRVTVPVPAGANPVQRILLGRYQLSGPQGITVSSRTSQTIAPGSPSGTVLDVPLSAGGTITLTLPAGYAAVRLQGLGVTTDATPPAGKPAKVTLPKFATAVHVNTTVTVTGALARVPSGATLDVERRLPGEDFAVVASTPAGADGYQVATPALVAAGKYEYRAVLRSSGLVQDVSVTRALRVQPAAVTLAAPRATRPSGAKVALSGVSAGAPAGGRLEFQTRAAGARWQTAVTKAAATAFTARVPLGAPGPLRLRVRLVSGDTVWAVSGVHRVQVTG